MVYPTIVVFSANIGRFRVQYHLVLTPLCSAVPCWSFSSWCLVNLGMAADIGNRATNNTQWHSSSCRPWLAAPPVPMRVALSRCTSTTSETSNSKSLWGRHRTHALLHGPQDTQHHSQHYEAKSAAEMVKILMSAAPTNSKNKDRSEKNS